MTLAFHVLANTGFGTNFSFGKIDDPLRSLHTMTWSRASNIVRENMLVIVAIPSRILSMPLSPTCWRKASRAIEELRRYMEQSLNKEQRNLSQGSTGSGNLLSSLVRSSEEAKPFPAAHAEYPIEETPGLPRADVLGDIYVFSLAGHETTGNVLTFAVYLLAAHPEVQAWVQEEIDLVYKYGGPGSASDYKLYPRFKRCLAIMLETLRLFPSVIAVPKYTRSEQKLNVDGKEHVIPPKTTVILNITAIHTHPQYWGEDSLIWRPSRWIGLGDASNDSPPLGGNAMVLARLKDEDVHQPAPGTFFPWSDGSRVCPGMRYSKVEFVAILSTLLRQHRVAPRRLKNESEEDARRRVLNKLGDCRFAMTLYMADPKSVTLYWTAR
ncbi:MAG: hypothetical protein Q9216_002993 [Gyalolechia sp. 2 TL-2023]